MVLMVYTAVDQVLVVNPCGANGLHSAVRYQVLVVNPCVMVYTLQSIRYWWLTLVVLMVYTAVDQVLVVNPCGANGLHSAVDQVLVVNPCGANGLHCSRSGTGG